VAAERAHRTRPHFNLGVDEPFLGLGGRSGPDERHALAVLSPIHRCVSGPTLAHMALVCRLRKRAGSV